MKIRKAANAIMKVPPITINALVASTRKELDTKVAKTMNGMSPRTIKTTRKRGSIELF